MSLQKGLDNNMNSNSNVFFIFQINCSIAPDFLISLKTACVFFGFVFKVILCNSVTVD